ncbi:MAG: hypothetical protein WKF58_15610 [Ilumatobacteraceae bacterium]
MVKRREDLTAPRSARRFDVHYGADAFGRFSESIARFLGTGRYLVFQTGLIVAWIAANLLPPALPVRPVGTRPRAAHARPLVAGVVRRATHPARPEPPGITRPASGRARS